MKQLKRPRNQEFVKGGEMLELKTKICPCFTNGGQAESLVGGSNGNWGRSLHLQRDLAIFFGKMAISTPFGCHKK